MSTYTVGRREAYELYFDTDPCPQKLGKGKDHQGNDYGGGCVFRTESDARRYLVQCQLADTYAVYGLAADWDDDAEQLPGEPYRRLLRNANLIRLKSVG